VSPPTEHEHRFVESLEKLVKQGNRGALAELRRGLGRPPGTAFGMYPHVAWATANCRSRWEEHCYYILASLFAAWHQGAEKTTPGAPANLGASLRECARGENRRLDEDRLKPIERRFVALLNSHPDDLHAHLRHAVSLLRAEQIPVNWAQLLYDLTHWRHDSRFVQRRWAKAFWAPVAPSSETEPDQTPAEAPNKTL